MKTNENKVEAKKETLTKAQKDAKAKAEAATEFLILCIPKSGILIFLINLFFLKIILNTNRAVKLPSEFAKTSRISPVL